MKPRTLAVVAALALGLAAFIVFYERDLPSSDERRQGAKRVLTVDKKQVDEVIIERRTSPAETIRLLRTAGAEAADDPNSDSFALTPTGQPIWRLEKPLQARADGWVIDRLLDSLISLESQRRLEDPDRAGLGLDAPRVVVTLRGTFGERVLEVGAAHPVGNAMAVAVRGEDSAAIVSDAVFAELAKGAGDWRSREVFVGDREAIRSIDLGRGAERVSLVRDGEGYRVAAPFADRADRDKVNALLSELEALRAQSFVEPVPSEVTSGFSGAPWIEVTSAVAAGAASAATAAPPPFHLELGPTVSPATAVAPQADQDPASERRFARADGVTIETDTALARTLETPIATWRSPAWSAAEIFRIEGVELTGEGGVLVKLTRDGTDWKRELGTEAAGESVRVSFGPVSDLLYAVNGARAQEVLDRSAAITRGARLSSVTRSFRFRWKDGGESLALHPALAGGEVPATSGDRDAVLLLSANTVAELVEKEAAVRAAEPVQPATADE